MPFAGDDDPEVQGAKRLAANIQAWVSIRGKPAHTKGGLIAAYVSKLADAEVEFMYSVLSK